MVKESTSFSVTSDADAQFVRKHVVVQFQLNTRVHNLHALFRASCCRLELPSAFTIEGVFRTAVDKGVLLYNYGDGAPTSGDVFLLELYDGVLYLVLRLDGVVRRFPLSERRLSDGQEHYFKIERDRR